MKIYSPNKEYTGVSASVPFCNGMGETEDPYLIKWFKDHGYKVDEESNAEQKGEKTAEIPADVPADVDASVTVTGKAAKKKAGQ